MPDEKPFTETPPSGSGRELISPIFSTGRSAVGMIGRFMLGPLDRDRPWLGLGLGAALFVLAGVSRFFLGGLSEGFGPMTFLPAILLASLFGGIRVGLITFGVCLFVAWVWFFPPYGTFALAPRDAISMAIFILTAVLEIYVIRSLNIAISDLAHARERSNILFRELQHRVANNLQLVAALLRMRRRTVEDGSPGAHALDAARSRLDLMSRVHRRLHDPAAVDRPLERHLEDLSRDLIQASAVPDVRLQVEIAPVHLELEALMSLSMIVAELVTNSLKHAFAGRAEGNIAISLSAKKGTCTLTVTDDGRGRPNAPREAKGSGLGQNILQSLAAQLHGTISFDSGPGTTARLVFPLPSSPRA